MFKATSSAVEGHYRAVEAIYRSECGRVVAKLIRIVGDFDLAE